MRLGAANLKAFKAKVEKAKAFRGRKVFKYKKLIFKSIQRTLYAERVWLQEVIAEFNSNRLEQALACWR